MRCSTQLKRSMVCFLLWVEPPSNLAYTYLVLEGKNNRELENPEVRETVHDSRNPCRACCPKCFHQPSIILANSQELMVIQEAGESRALIGDLKTI